MSVVTGDSVYLLPSYKLVIKTHDFAFLNRDWTRMNILFGKYAVIIHFIQQTISKYKTITFTYRLYKACTNFIFFPVIRNLVNTSIRNLIPQVEPIYRNRLAVVMAAYRPEPNQAQDVVRCKICGNDKVKYFMYCKNCGDKMCPQCQEEHIKHFENHVIVPNDERQFAGEHCKEHPTQFYDAGCKDCSTPICPECKLKYHFSHKNTSIEKACKSARKKVETNLKQMVTRHCRVTSFINEGTNFGNIQDFQQIKKNLKIRALELKSCVEKYSFKVTCGG